MRWRLAISVAFVALGAAGTARSEQGGAFPVRGSRVRITLPGERTPVVGTLVSEDGETLVLARDRKKGSEMTVRLDSVETLEVSRSRTGLGVGAGLLAGVALAGGLGGTDLAWSGACLAFPGASVGTSWARRGGGVAGGALMGAAASAALFTGLALVLSSAGGGDSWWSTGEMVAGGAASGAVFGALSGAVGAAVAHERWETVPTRRLRVSVGPIDAQGGLAAAVHVAF
jgi:hypothetical protein